MLCFLTADIQVGCRRTGSVVECDGRLVGGGLLGQVELAGRVREGEAGGEGEEEGAGNGEGEFERGEGRVFKS